MVIYTGSVYRLFLIDRHAMGFGADTIRDEFERQYGIPIKVEEIEHILAGAEEEIKDREIQLISELRSSNVFGQLEDIQKDLHKAREVAKGKGDLKEYAQLTNTALHTLEILLKMMEKLKNSQNMSSVANAKNNLIALQLLEQDGIIVINDKGKLRRFVGVPDDDKDTANAGTSSGSGEVLI
jgi:hypothetical protein